MRAEGGSRTGGRSLPRRLLTAGILVAVAVAVLVWPAAWLLEGQARTVQLIAPFDEATVGVNRFQYEEEPTGADADVVAIYGTAFGEPRRVLFAHEDRLLHPPEKPALLLMKKTGDENPLQVETVHFVARMTSIGAAIAAFLLVLVLLVVRRRAARPRA